MTAVGVAQGGWAGSILALTDDHIEPVIIYIGYIKIKFNVPTSKILLQKCKILVEATFGIINHFFCFAS